MQYAIGGEKTPTFFGGCFGLPFGGGGLTLMFSEVLRGLGVCPPPPAATTGLNPFCHKGFFSFAAHNTTTPP
ncbi:hypothetical protein CWI53_08010 [Neisseria meningitidis]|nr:hypothetical protein CWI53_08010 [Neisseria meningitidis]